jgi:hypothetical protein
MNEGSWEVYTQVLSRENLKLTYSDKAKTAYFNLDSREVVVPTFEYMNDEVTQLLISHEVGHASYSTYTKDEFNNYSSRYGDLFNVIEDAHIENRLKKNFGGLSAIFKEGYKTLHKENFFELEDNLSAYSLTSRLNLFYKIGHIVDVPFDGKENEFAVAMKRIFTKEDCIQLCEDVILYLNTKEEEKQQNNEDDNFDVSSEEENGFSQMFDGEDTSLDEETSYNVKVSSNNSLSNEVKKELIDEVSSILDKNISEYGERMLEDNYSFKTSSRNTLSISSKECFKNCYDVTMDYHNLKQRTFYTSKACRTLEKQIKELAKSADVVFHQKKKAEELKNTKNVQNGRLNRRSLSKYLISDNIFQKTKVLKEGKNHGVVILVDYSSSMIKVIKDTLIQACVLGEFCKMNDIPFSIVAFGITCHRKRDKMTAILGHNDAFNIGCIMSLMKDIQNYRMGYTPTVEALGVATHIVDAYHKAGVQKSSVFLITDGFYSSIRIKDGVETSFDTSQPFVIIDNVLYDINKTIPSKTRIHNNWIIELFFLNLKMRYNTFISVSFICPYETVLKCLHPDTLHIFKKKTSIVRGYNSRENENYLYLWKHSLYFEDIAKVKAELKNGILSYEFKKNPFLDLFQLFDYTSINESEENILVKSGNYNKRLKTLVNEFIERFA